MVRAEKIRGILAGVLLRIADQLEKDQELRRKVKSAMTYPIIQRQSKALTRMRS